MKFINLKNMSEEEHISSESILCLGNFDGVHIGHRQLVASLFDQYTSLKTQFPSLCTGVWLFDSSSYKQVHEIYSLNEKLNVFANLGLDYAVVADFNEMKSLSPDQFVKDILKLRCNCIYAICGENFKFGSKAVGNSNTLKELMIGQATIVSLLSIDDDQNFESPIIVSSTLIRSLLSQGDISKANFLLSDKYSITEEVIHGKALGRTIGIPTINQIPSTKQLILKNGIYATTCSFDGKKYLGVTNIGVRPTIDNDGVKNIETHLIDFEGDCYGKKVKVEFIAHLRDEIKFDDIECLKKQIQQDIESTKQLYSNM